MAKTQKTKENKNRAKDTRLHLRIGEKHKEDLRKLAETQGITISDLIFQALLNYLPELKDRQVSAPLPKALAGEQKRVVTYVSLPANIRKLIDELAREHVTTVSNIMKQGAIEILIKFGKISRPQKAQKK